MAIPDGIGRGLRHWLVCMLCAMAMLTGCATPASYTAPVTQFQQASAVVIESARAAYRADGQRERDNLIDRYVAERRPFSNEDVLHQGVLSPQALRIRMQVLDTLARHGTLLLSLAGSDAGTRAQTAAHDVAAAVVELNAELAKPGHAATAFKNQATSVGAAVGLVAQYAIERRIERALNEAIAQSAAPVQRMLQLLKQDADLMHDRQTAIATEVRRRAYEAVRDELARRPAIRAESLAAAVVQLKLGAAAEDAAYTAPPLGESLDAMDKAHRELVAYAQSAKSPQDFSDLVDAMDTFVGRAAALASALRTARVAFKE